MGTLSLVLPDGRTGTVTVDDRFASLPSDQQEAMIDQIKSSIPSNANSFSHQDQGVIHAISADGVVHRFPGGTDSTVIDKTMKDYAGQQTAAANPSFTNDLQGGLHDLGTSVSQGLNVAGGVMSRNGMPEWGSDVSGAGDWAQSHTPDAPAGPAPSEQLAASIRNGDWSSVPGLAIHSAVRAIPSAAPVLAAGAVGGPLAAGAAAGALAEGPEAYARAANNGRSQPTTADDLAAVPGAVAEGVGGALLPGSSKLASPLARGAYRIGSDIAGGAIMDTSGQLGATVGTDRGAQLDPYQTASAALTQGAMGAARVAPETAASGVKAASDRAMAATLEAPATREDAESVIRVGQLMDDIRQNAVNTSGRALPDTVIANSVKSDLVTKLNSQVKQLRNAGLIDTMDANDLRQLVNNQALRSNNTISDGLPGVASLYDRLDDLDLPDSVRGQLKADIRDLNTVSSQSFIKNTVGPFQQVGGLAGRIGAVGAGVLSGSPMGVLDGVIGNPLAGRIGGAVGAMVDRTFGTNTPPIVLQRLNAQRVLRQMGVDPSVVGPTGEAIIPSPAPTPDPTPAPNPPFRRPNLINPPSTPSPVPPFIRPTIPQPRPSPTPPFIRPDVAPPPPSAAFASDPSQVAASRSQLGRIRAQAQALMAANATTSGPDPQTGLPSSPIPVNTPTRLDVAKAPSVSSLPPLKVDTADTVRAAIDQADQQLGADTPIVPNPQVAQRLQAAQAALLVPPAQAPSIGSPGGFTPGSKYLANTIPGANHADAVALARAAEVAGVVPPGTADLIDKSPAPMDRQLLETIKAHAAGNAQAPGGTDQPVIHSPIRYQAAVDKYHMHVMNDVAAMRKAGQHDAANAMLDIAVNMHTKADKRAARAALPPAVAKQIPDYVVNQGGN